MEKPFPTEHPILEVLARRWSPRAIDPLRPVPRETILTLLEAARAAPSSFNEQPWRFLVFDGQDRDALKLARSCLAAGNAWARSAPALLLSVAAGTGTLSTTSVSPRKIWPSRPPPSDWPFTSWRAST